MNTAGAIAAALAGAGIQKTFGLPGGEVLVLIDELRKAGVDFVLMRHEANAGLAAAVYGKLKRQPGVVIATLGPGAANLLLPVANAYLDQEPLLAITAQLPDDFPPSHTHQLLPLHDTYRPMCRVVDTITHENADIVVDRALRACMDRPYGVSFLTLSAREAIKEARPGGARFEGPPTRPMANPATHAADLRARCAIAKRPMVLVGLGIEPHHAERLRRWVNGWQLPVAVTPKVKGIVDETLPNFVGVISGMAADGVMLDALKAADLLIGVGLDPVEIDKTWHAELDIQWVLEARNATGVVPANVSLVDHGQLLDAVGRRCGAGELGQTLRGIPEQARRAVERHGWGRQHDVAWRYHSRALERDAAGNHRHHRCRVAQVLCSANTGRAACPKHFGCPTDCRAWRMG